MSSGAPSGQAISGAAADAVYTQLGAGLLQQYCFPASTKITTRRGEVAIEEVSVGDEVSAANQFDPSGPIRWKRVIELYRNKPAELINIHAGDLPVIRATLNHPFYVRDKGFIPAADLKPGDVLRTADGWAPVTETFRNGDVEPVFNFCVEDWHTYFAGGVLVHNDSWLSSAWDSVASAAETVGNAAAAVGTRADQLAGQVGMLVLDQKWVDKEGASGLTLLGGGAEGAITSGKVAVNGTVKAAVSTATFGQVEAGDAITVTDHDRQIGYDGAEAIFKGSAEVAAGALTGSAATKLAQGGKLAQAAGTALRVHDAASNVVGVGTGVNDIVQKGANLQNVAQVAAGALATAGDLAGVARGKPVPKVDQPVVAPSNSLAGSAPNINPGYPGAGRTQNCVNCSIAADKTFAGNPASALPSAGPRPISVVSDTLGGRFIRGVAGKADIEHAMSQLGPGARGVVFGERATGAGHVFNVVVDKSGAVKFFDGQTGKAASFNGFTGFRLLITNAN